jgi:hypothetical protein
MIAVPVLLFPYHYTGPMLRYLVTALLVLLLGACASPVSKDTPMESAAKANWPGERSWRHLRLNFAANPDGRVDWHLDALAANEVFAPLLDKYRAQIPLWRFHRRAAADAAGHQFSLIIFSNRQIAESIVRAVDNHPTTVALQRAGVLRRLSTELDVAPERKAISATSDPNWSEDLQRSWPWFAMGVSQAWLALLQQQLTAEQPQDIEQLIQHYASANQAVNGRWREQSAHAYLHHLNALFGYESLTIRGRGGREVQIRF